METNKEKLERWEYESQVRRYAFMMIFPLFALCIGLFIAVLVLLNK